MSLGYMNRFIGKMQAQTEVVGDATDNAVVGSRFVLDHRARLIGARVSISAHAGSETSGISVLVDAATDYLVVDQFTTLSSSIFAGNMTLTAAKKGKIFAAGTAFYMKEECSTDADLNGLSVDLYFRSHEA